MLFSKALPLSIVLLSATTLSAFSASMAPHRAVYDIKFQSAQADSKIIGGSGKWVLELNGAACTGYNVSYRFVTQLEDNDGINFLLDTRGKNFESGEGNAFDFSNSTYQDNRIIEDVKGVASRKDGSIGVRLSRPEAVDTVLSEDVQFPVQHFIKLIEKAKAGEKLVSSTVYEGVEGGMAAFDVTAAIAKEGEVEKGKSLPYQALEDKKLRRWPVSLSYYRITDEQDTTPEWANSFVLYENGVTRQFVFDYGQFALTGTMRELEFLPEEDCS
ncbi:MAG: DUF1849 family protein [Hyphomicrobiales bacterium]